MTDKERMQQAMKVEALATERPLVYMSIGYQQSATPQTSYLSPEDARRLARLLLAAAAEPTADTSLFGLTIEYVEPYSDDDKPGWKVYLPHQCDGWRIDEANAYEDPTDQATALARLDAFIAEAQAAREALASGRPVEWDYQGCEAPYTRIPRPDEAS